MNKDKKICRHCGKLLSEQTDYKLLFEYETDQLCDECIDIQNIIKFVSDYSHSHSIRVWSNEVHERNRIKDNYDYGNGVTSYTLASHKSLYRVEKRTKRVQALIDKIIYIRKYLYFSLSPIFEILDSIYINHDKFWEETGNLLRYVHNTCFEEAVLKLSELLIDRSCKYSINKIKNSLLAESKYVFKEQEIYERVEFENSGDIIEERFEPFNINEFADLVSDSVDHYRKILDALKDYRDTQFAHIDTLKSKESPKALSYVNLKRMFSLVKAIYDGFLYVVAPDKYATIIFDSNISFFHLNEMTDVYKKDHEEKMKRIKEEMASLMK